MNVVRATYGAVDNSHGLLKSTCPARDLPSGLENLTDRPPGDLMPGERWAPAIGCTAIGDWWCLWWTEPDSSVGRPGMVKSEVALLPLCDVGELDSLVPILEILSDNRFQYRPLKHGLAAFVEVFLNHPQETVLIPHELDDWPNVLSAMWENLWPAARMGFSARVALSPPQVASASKGVQLFCVPKAKENQWHTPFRKFKLDQEPENSEDQPVGRAALYLAGVDDPMLTDLLQTFPPEDSGFARLKTLARVADLIDSLKVSPSLQSSVALVRSLINLGGTHTQFGRDAVRGITDSLKHAGLEDLLTMANLDIDFGLFESPLIPELENSFENVLKGAEDWRINKLLNTLLPGHAQPWWRDSLSSAISNGIARKDRKWLDLVARCLGDSKFSVLISRLLPPGMEPEILGSLENTEFERIGSINELIARAEEKNWSRVHAWCLLKTGSLASVLERQTAFPIDPEPGINYLLANLPIDRIIVGAIEIESDLVFDEAARLCSKNPEQLCQFDIGNFKVRKLWSQHIKYGGERLPCCLRDKDCLARLVDLAIQGEECFGLLGDLCEYLSITILFHPKREQVWESLDEVEARILLPLVAKEFIKSSDSMAEMREPEYRLAESVLSIAEQSPRPSSSLIVSMLNWRVLDNQTRAIEWIRTLSDSDWQNYGQKIGETTVRRRWKSVAQEISGIATGVPSAKPAADIGASLIPSPLAQIGSFFFPWSLFQEEKQSSYSSYAKRVAELGAQLSPHELYSIWERAGGDLAVLPVAYSPRAAWQAAAKMADNGALPGGLRALVEELIGDYPSNQSLVSLLREINRG